MKCETVEELVSALLDDELTPADRTRVEEHTRLCPSCARAYVWLQGTRAAVRTLSLQQHELPPGFWPAVLRRLDVPEQARAGQRLEAVRPWLVRIPVRAAASVGIAAAVVALALGIAWFAPLPQDRAAGPVPVALLALDFEQQVIAPVPPQPPRDAFAQTASLSAPQGNCPAALMRAPNSHMTFLGHSTRYVNGVMAVQLTYASGPHWIALYQLPADQTQLPAGMGATGFGRQFHVVRTERCSVVAWADGDIAYAAVSDLPAGALLEVAQSLAQAARSPGA